MHLTGDSITGVASSPSLDIPEDISIVHPAQQLASEGSLDTTVAGLQ